MGIKEKELERQNRWHRTYNASLTGLRSLSSMASLPRTGAQSGNDLITAQAVYLKEIATADANAIHGPLDPDADMP